MNYLYKNKLFKYGFILILLIITVSCSKLLVNVESSGDMNLTLDAMRSITSELDVVPVSYRLEGSNGGGATFDFVTADTNVQIPDLSTGEWQIRVRAYNTLNQVIAEGIGTLEVQPGGYSSMTIVLYDTTGSGSLDFSLSWNDDLVWNESVEVSLKNLNGDEIPLVFNQDTGFASGLFDDLSAGFYTLEVKLFDDLILAMGAMELVQIRESSVTNVNLDFSQLNKPGQRISVTADSFTISWNADLAANADEFRIYYREHGSFIWTYLGSTLFGTTLEYTIDQSAIPFGVYDLAVSSVEAGVESELHSSMDDSAVPATGWYVDWVGL
jgi:hypothetical protein